MTEEHTQQPSTRGKSRRERVEHARSRDILDVASELRIELFRSGRDYRWKEHDSLVISPDTNLWHWFSRHEGGDVIALVQTMKEVNFNQAIDYLNDGTFKAFTSVERAQEATSVERAQEAFSYYLKPYEQPFDDARTYLKEQRGLSDETIDFFLEKGVLAQANAKVGDEIEPVLVFKNLDVNGQVVGAALQGLVANPDKYFGRGYLKQIMKNSQPYNGMHVDIGTPDRLIFAESSIDLMSYYELHKDSLSDVRLVSLEGLKIGTMGRHLVQLQSEMERRPLSSRWTDDKLAQGLDEAVKQEYFKDGKNSHLLTLAVDHDAKGKELIQELTDMGVPVIDATPPKAEGQAKMDWNAYLQETKATFSTERYQEEIDNLISDITLGDEAYYLWHDHELVNLGANESIIEEFHSKLEDNRYVVNQAELYVEDSANDGATGYLSLEGHVLDKDGIEDYLSEQMFSDTEKVSFLETLQTELPNIWDKVTNHYDKVFETVVNQYSQKLSTASMISEGTEKPLDGQQEAVSNSEQQKKERTYLRMGSLQPEAEGSPTPEVAETTSFERSVTSRPTVSPLYLNFSISDKAKSIKTQTEHSISQKDLAKINRRGHDIQEAAQFYRDELANSKITYFTADGNIVQVNFLEKNFMHLTGLKPLGKNQTPEKTLHDFANGGELHYDNILVGNNDSALTKVKVLPDLKVALETDSFYFDNLQGIDRYKGRFDSLIKADDRDIMLLFRADTEDGTVPVSVFKVRRLLSDELLHANKNDIMGIYRERHGEIEQIAINEDYIRDGGQEMLSILENKQYEETIDVTQEMIQSDVPSAELFTQVLDAAYHVGEPRKLGTSVPEESKEAWERYYELSDAHEGNFSAVVNAADQLGIVDKNSNFYQEWHQDRIYKETYHVRLQWLENWPDSPQIPFKKTELVEYQTFAKELYKQNSAFYERYQESMATGNQADYIPFTKVQFDVYAPGGILIKDNVRYDIGDETEPISRLLGLGYRRLEGQPELAAIDNKVLSQLEKQKVNQEIATEANEQNAKTQGGLPDEENNDRKSFHSPNQEIKTSLDQKVAAIVTKEAASNQVNENEQKRESSMTPDEPFDYTSASAYDISEHAFQKIREYTQTPEDLLEYMDFMSKFPQLSPRNVALIHDQWRGANAVATYNQWQVMGEALGIKPEDVIPTKAIYTNKRTGETKEVIHQGLSVKTGEKSKITLFRPLMVRMIPVLDDNGKQLKNDKGNPKYKKLSEATPQEKAWVKEGNLPVRQFQERDLKTGQPKFTTYKVFELSQTTLKPESYPKAMPNRHYNFNMDKVKTREVLEGLCDYAESIGIKMMKDEAHVLDNAKGAFYPEEQLILINPDNTPGEKIATTIHELAHATLHNPKLGDQYKELTKGQKEFEAEMTSYLLSKHFGLDTSEKAIDYMAKWTDNLKALDDKQLTNSFKRVHKTVSKMLKQVETHTKPYQMGKKREKLPNFPKSPSKGPSR